MSRTISSRARHLARPQAAAWPTVSLLALLLALLCAPSAGAQARDPLTIGEIRFEGLVTVDSALVRQTVTVAPGQPLQPFQVSQSVQAIYALEVFADVTVETLAAGEGKVALVFHLVERQPVGEVTYEGNEFFSAEDVRETSGLRPGQILSRADLFRARRKIEEAYRNEGYAQARVETTVSAPKPGEVPSVLVRIVEGARVKLREIRLAGNERVPADELRGALELKPAGFLRKGRFTRQKLEEDVERLAAYYRNHGYRDVQVTAEEPGYSEDGRDVAVTFRIVEGPQYLFADASWDGATAVDSTRLAEATRVVPGEVFDQSKIDASRAAAIELYTERGYLTGLRIEPETTVEGERVRVVFHVEEGEPSHVGDVRIIGNTTTRERVIRRELTVYPGSLLRRSQLLRSQRDVFATGFFEDVQMEFAAGEKPDEVDLVFRVKEKSSVVATAGAGYSSQVGLTGFVEFGHNNLFGRGQSLSVKLERGGRREFYDLSFTEPWVFGRPISTGFDLYRTEYYREIYTGDDDGEQSYWQYQTGGGVRFGLPWMFRFPDYTRLALGYSLSETRYKDFENIPASTQTLLEEGSGTLSRGFVSVTRNSTDNPFHPTLGTRTTWRNEFNGGILGGDMDYYQLTLDHRQYFVPFWKPVVMLRWRLGTMGRYTEGGRLPPAERFRMGGTTGFDFLRGYQDYYVVPEENVGTDESGREIRFPGGLALFGFTAELQFPIFSPVWGSVFVDAGNTWNSFYDASLNDLKIGTGVGLSLEIPMLGPIGFYYAYGGERRKWVTHFAFGTQL